MDVMDIKHGIYFVAFALGTWQIFNHIVHWFSQLLALYVETSVAMYRNPQLQYADYQTTCILKNTPFKSYDEWLGGRMLEKVAINEQQCLEIGWVLWARRILVFIASVAGLAVYMPIINATPTWMSVVYFLAYFVLVFVLKLFTEVVMLKAVAKRNEANDSDKYRKFSHLLVTFMPKVFVLDIGLFAVLNVASYAVMKELCV